MTSKEFNEALKAFRNHQLPMELYIRIFVACLINIKHRLGIDDKHFVPTHDECVNVLDGLDRCRRGRLKRVVERIVVESTEPTARLQ